MYNYVVHNCIVKAVTKMNPEKNSGLNVQAFFQVLSGFATAQDMHIVVMTSHVSENSFNSFTHRVRSYSRPEWIHWFL